MRIQGVPKFSFMLTDREIDVLVTVAKLHYDHSCRQAAVNGILFSWKRSLSFCETGTACEVSGNFRDLDLVCKIIEGSNVIGMPPSIIAICNKINSEFAHALSESNRRFRDWCVELDDDGRFRSAL
jgi:hypothetical protein